MGLTEFLSFCGFGTFFGGMSAFLIQRYIKRRDERRDKEAAEKEQERAAKQAELQAKTEALEAQNTATQLGVQALLRDRLLQAFKFYIGQGFAAYDDRQNILNMYKQYEALGPNQVMETYYDQFEALPFNL